MSSPFQDITFTPKNIHPLPLDDGFLSHVRYGLLAPWMSVLLAVAVVVIAFSVRMSYAIKSAERDEEASEGWKATLVGNRLWSSNDLMALRVLSVVLILLWLVIGFVRPSVSNEFTIGELNAITQDTAMEGDGISKVQVVQNSIPAQEAMDVLTSVGRPLLCYTDKADDWNPHRWKLTVHCLNDHRDVNPDIPWIAF